jgi:SAM-dependent methyltransferase
MLRSVLGSLRPARGNRAGTDQGTTAYFDQHVPEYSVRHARRAVQLICAAGPRDATLVDIGCGVGTVLALLAETSTGISRLVGFDVSAACLEETRQKVDAELHQASILDQATIESFRGQFDFALMAAVLHHLVGPTRRHSRRIAETAIANSLMLLKPGGYLVIAEPTFAPSAPLGALFWAKRLSARLTQRRLPIGGYWNNLGPPVVSYYSPAQLRALVAGLPAAEIVFSDSAPQRLNRLGRALVAKTNTTMMIRTGQT